MTEIGPAAVGVAGGVTRRGDIGRAFDAKGAHGGRSHIVVNNAG